MIRMRVGGAKGTSGGGSGKDGDEGGGGEAKAGSVKAGDGTERVRPAKKGRRRAAITVKSGGQQEGGPGPVNDQKKITSTSLWR